MTLFSGPTDIYSHQVRIVLAEKGVSFEIEHVAVSYTHLDVYKRQPLPPRPAPAPR